MSISHAIGTRESPRLLMCCDLLATVFVCWLNRNTTLKRQINKHANSQIRSQICTANTKFALELVATSQTSQTLPFQKTCLFCLKRVLEGVSRLDHDVTIEHQNNCKSVLHCPHCPRTGFPRVCSSEDFGSTQVMSFEYDAPVVFTMDPDTQ